MESMRPNDEEFISRCPSESFVSPKSLNKPVAIKPLKRAREDEEQESSEGHSPSGTDRAGSHSPRPRRLDFDQEVVLASQFNDEKNESDDEEVERTQPYPPEPEIEEGEIREPESDSEVQKKD
jgi:hypothetical protein